MRWAPTSPRVPAAQGKVTSPAYVDGLRAEGLDVDEETVARANALLMLEFFALSAIPFEALGGEVTPQVRHVAGERAQAARFVLELVHATA
jgi:hypothetical protein